MRYGIIVKLVAVSNVALGDWTFIQHCLAYCITVVERKGYFYVFGNSTGQSLFVAHRCSVLGVASQLCKPVHQSTWHASWPLAKRPICLGF